MIELSLEEKGFLINVLRQLSISPASQDALKTVETVQSIVQKLAKGE